jgi:hypothetical protein
MGSLRMLTSRDFTIGSVQAIAFTPRVAFSTTALLTHRDLAPWVAQFDGQPTILPLPPDTPPEIPRILLNSADGTRKCEISLVRIAIARLRQETAPVDVREFLGWACRLLIDYRSASGATFNRLGAVVERYATCEQPAPFLARHFCREEWLKQPFNRAEAFELNAYKKYRMGSGWQVNSWVRNKTGSLSDGKSVRTPVVIVQHDINTPSVEKEPVMEVGEINAFFESVPTEFESTLGLYYPERHDESANLPR